MKTRKSTTDRLIADYEHNCDVLAALFLKQLGLSDHPDDAFWIVDKIGTLLDCNAGDITVCMETIVSVLRNGMEYDDFMEWYWQWTEFDHETFEPLPGRINLDSWLMGARPQEDAKIDAHHNLT